MWTNPPHNTGAQPVTLALGTTSRLSGDRPSIINPCSSRIFNATTYCLVRIIVAWFAALPALFSVIPVLHRASQGLERYLSPPLKPLHTLKSTELPFPASTPEGIESIVTDFLAEEGWQAPSFNGIFALTAAEQVNEKEVLHHAFTSATRKGFSAVIITYPAIIHWVHTQSVSLFSKFLWHVTPIK